MRDSMLILTGEDVRALLEGRERELLEATRQAYLTHRAGQTNLPGSSFVRFPEQPRNRIIGLPAYLGGDFQVAGMKWISSFPGNLERGLERASAVGVLNSMETGRAEVMFEASLISAKRTAASAALAAEALHRGRDARRAALIGLGPINFEIARFLSVVFADLEELVVFDTDRARAEQFRSIAEARLQKPVNIVSNIGAALDNASLISFATTALEPHIDSVPSRSTILHISLRDIFPKVIAAADNIVDDIDHVLTARTSLHLTELELGHRRFIRGTLADILSGAAPAHTDAQATTIFSPFGMGILDLAVAKVVLEHARASNRGAKVPDFFPAPWTEAR